MPKIIKCCGYATPQPCPFEGQFLEWYDPDLPGEGALAGFTRDASKAKTFPDGAAALEEWRRVRSVDPVRPDGKPNRPLTAFTVELVEVR